jgi:hypothetical protein
MSKSQLTPEWKEKVTIFDSGQVIAAMTVGKDVSMLFPDVCNCMQVKLG